MSSSAFSCLVIVRRTLREAEIDESFGWAHEMNQCITYQGVARF